VNDEPNRASSEGLSIRKYAAHRRALGLPGASKWSVQKALRDGRISRNEAGKIDPATADREWEMNTDPSWGGVRGPGEGHGEALAAPELRLIQGGDDSSTLSRARAEHETYKAKLAQLNFEREAGSLVRKGAMEREYFTQARRLRDAVLSVPDRMDSIVAAESDPRKVRELLQQALEDALQGLRYDTDAYSAD